jgi:hypothetical protein
LAADAVVARLHELQLCSDGWFKIVTLSVGKFGKVDSLVDPPPATLQALICSKVPLLLAKTST